MWRPAYMVEHHGESYHLRSPGYQQKKKAESKAEELRSPRQKTVVKKMGPRGHELWFVYAALVDIMAEV